MSGVRVALAFALLGCAGNQVQTTPAPVDAPPAPVAETPSCPEPIVASEGFEHTRSRVLAGDPRHVAIDAIGRVGSAFEAEAKLHYGPLGADLRDERVSVFVRGQECGAWELVETTQTDDSGWASVELEVDTAGELDIRFVVHGDGSVADARAYIREEGTEVVVFDVDGTLTVDDTELVAEVIDANYDPRAHPGAIDVARWHQERGAFVVYITGRPYFFASQTRRWLERHEFPVGPLLMTHTIDEAREGVQEYKRAALTRLSDDLEFNVGTAYGNATTDVCAYAEAEIPTALIIGPHAGTTCPGHDASTALGSYEDHLVVLRGGGG